MKKIMTGLLLGLFTVSCNMPEEGFFSERGIMMREDTVIVTRGLFQMSAIPMVDGTTRPILFEMLQVTDLKTGLPIDLGTYEINMWTSAFDPNVDSTMDLVNRKLVKRKVSPFELNPASGQVVFNGATQYLTGELYGLDVKISNVNSSKVFEKFCIFKLISEPFKVQANFGDMLNGIPDTGEKDRVGLQAATSGSYPEEEKDMVRKNTHPNRKLTKLADGDFVNLIMVVRDAEGKPFKGKDIVFWPSGAAYLNNYHDNSLAMSGNTEKIQYTDTSCVFTFPTVPYPAYGREYASGDNLYLAYYCIDWAACKFSPAGQQLLNDYQAKNPNAKPFVTYSPRFRNGYKINETGTWLMEIKNPYILRK